MDSTYSYGQRYIPNCNKRCGQVLRCQKKKAYGQYVVEVDVSLRISFIFLHVISELYAKFVGKVVVVNLPRT